jgi:hypothetical protein
MGSEGMINRGLRQGRKKAIGRFAVYQELEAMGTCITFVNAVYRQAQVPSPSLTLIGRACCRRERKRGFARTPARSATANRRSGCSWRVSSPTKSRSTERKYGEGSQGRGKEHASLSASACFHPRARPAALLYIVLWRCTSRRSIRRSTPCARRLEKRPQTSITGCILSTKTSHL